jgi:ATP-dependent DNA helicase PIF1
MELSNEQTIAFNKYVQGQNIFITGPGGSGKSAFIQHVFRDACQKGKKIQVCALTGCAAVLLNCNAKTLHSWAGIGLGNGAIEDIVKKIQKNKFAKATWRETEVLIVDEVSMLSLKLFRLLNALGKAIRGNRRPFGGIHLVFSGDFYQLPPVGNKDDMESQQFCFESEDWSEVFPPSCQIEFVTIFRQTDNVYKTILNQIRQGVIKKKTNDLLEKYVGRERDPQLLVEPTKLFPTKNKVETINHYKMSLLESEERVFALKYLTDMEITKTERMERYKYSEKEIQMELEYLSGNLICEKEVKIKVGSQVMCVVNIPLDNARGGLEICNGSQGIVVGFCQATGFPRVKYNNGITMLMSRHIWLSEKIPGVAVSQVPLILAWALTIHKSQGATLDMAEIDVGSGIFECGQTYVALSRVKSLEGLYLTSFDATKIRIHQKVKNFYQSLHEESSHKPCLTTATATITSSTTTTLDINEKKESTNPFAMFELVPDEIIE